MQIPPTLLTKIDEAISHYPVSKRSASLPLLHLFQEHFGFISDEAIVWIAQKLELEPINILELVTFYPMFRRAAAGKHHIRICRTLSCAMAGAYELKAKICQTTGLPCDNHANGNHGGPAVSPDGKFSVEFVECLASCGSGPVCMVDDDFYEEVALDDVPKILSKYR